MDALLWAIGIPIGLGLIALALFIGVIVICVLIPPALIVGGIMVGGPIGGIMILVGAFYGLDMLGGWGVFGSGGGWDNSDT